MYWEIKLNHPSNTPGSFTLSLLYINIQSFERRQLFCLSKVIKWKQKTKKQNGNPKSMLFYFTGFWACCGLISCFFPRKKKKKVISLANTPGRDMHDWSWKVCLFLGKKNKRNFEKRRKNERYLYAGRDHTDPFSMLNYKSAPTNFLIVPTAAVLLSRVYFSLKIWKASRLALKVIRSRTGVPDASLLVSFASLFGCLCLAFKSFILFRPSLLWKWL